MNLKICISIALVSCSLCSTNVFAEGKIKTAADIPKSCSNPGKLYLERSISPSKETISNQPHDIWNLFAGSYTVKHDRGVDEGSAWLAYTPASPVKPRDTTNIYYTYPTEKNGKGWILGERYYWKAGHRQVAMFGFCPSLDSAKNRLILKTCSMKEDYPNFYAVTDKSQDFVFFDSNDKTYRLYVDESTKEVRYEECKKVPK